MLQPSSGEKLESRDGILQPRGFAPLPKDWVAEHGTIPSAHGGSRLFHTLYHHEPWSSPRAVIVFHGFWEHGGRYLHWPAGLGNTVDAVYCHDHRGHGRSEGLRGHAERFVEYLDDAERAIREFHDTLTRRFGSAELHAVGHSFGGLVLLNTLFARPDLPLRSAAVSAPLLGVKMPVPPVKALAGQLLSRVWGSFHMKAQAAPETLSHVPEVGQAYLQDRLVHDKITPRAFTEMNKAMAEVRRHHSGLNYPLLMLLPEEDQVVDTKVSLDFYRNLDSREKQLKTYPGMFHEIFNEVDRATVFGDLQSWIKNHTAKS